MPPSTSNPRNGSGQGPPSPPAELARQELQLQMQALASRDLQLWAIGVLVVLVLATGIVALVLPNLVWKTETLRVEMRYLPQLAFGFLALTVLFNLYVFEQRRELNNTRKALLQQLLMRQREDSLPLIDPLTQLFNRRFLDHLLPREGKRVERLGSSLGFLLVHLGDLDAVSTRFGNLAGEQYLVEAAELLERTFHGADLVLRYDEDWFLVVMPESAEQQVSAAAEQLALEVEAWNRATTRGYQMALSYGQAVYTEGADVAAALRQAEQNLRRQLQGASRTLGAMCPLCLFLGCGEEVTRALRPMLDSFGVAVEVCPRVEDGLEMLSRRKCDAVIAEGDDLESSAELLRQVRALPSGKSAILLLLLPREVNPDLGFKMGANFVLAKPLLPEMAAKSLRVAYGLMMAERRRYFRCPVEMPVTVSLEPGRVLQATATNISESGMALRDAALLEAGGSGVLRFQLPGFSNTIETKGEINWADAEGRVGVSFLSMPNGARRQLKDWLLETLHQEAELAAPLRGSRAGSQATAPVRVAAARQKLAS